MRSFLKIDRWRPTALLRVLCAVLCVLCVSSFSHALDREAFTFARYDLEVRVSPARQWLEAKGRITLRNDSAEPQRVATLQISSSLDWTSLRADGQTVQLLTQAYTSDVDHTGSLSEALVTLPQPVAPGQTVELEIAYAGIIPADSTRLRRIGAPAAVAARNDWDQIGESFTAVRGLGYVAWYPVALTAASFSEGNEVFDAIARWQERHAKSEARMDFCVQHEVPTPDAAWPVMNGEELAAEAAPATGAQRSAAGDSVCRRYRFAAMGFVAPAFAVGKYKTLRQPPVEVDYLPGQQQAAAEYAAAVPGLEPLVTDWFGPLRRGLRIVALDKPEAEPYESGAVLFTPLGTAERKSLQMGLAHSLTHAAFDSPRLWIEEGAAHFAQALAIEQQGGRAAAITYMEAQRPALVEAEASPAAPAAPGATPESLAAAQSLINSADAVFYRTKAMYVFWMLRDLLGDAALQRALKSYRAADDKTPAYLQNLAEAQATAEKSLEWFFDDWVYRDRGLPDFRVAAVYARPTLAGSFGVTVTVENLGGAGAEVAVYARSEHGQVSERVLVPAHGKGVARLLIPEKPREVSVNDGSVPESDLSNNSAPVPERQE